MDLYAAILNLEDADSHCLQQDELFDQELQTTVLRSVLLGHGQTEDMALTAAFSTLQDNGMLKVHKCASGVDNILEYNSGKDALRHLWLYDKYNGKQSRLHILPGHAGAVNFGRRYNLPEKAIEELSSLFNALLERDE